jgi:hypothetical protein
MGAKTLQDILKQPLRHKMNLQFFAENDEVEVKENKETTVEEPENKPKEVSEKTFTQAELDEIIAKRLERERKKQAELDEKLKRLEALEKAEEERRKAEMTEAERLKAEKEEAEKKAQEAAEQVKKAQESAQQRIINTEIRSVARVLNANDPNDVLALIDKSGIEIDDDGNVKGVDEAVKALKEAKPWMFKQVIGVDAVGGGNPPKNPSVSELSAKEKELEEIKQQAARNPRLLGKVTQLYNEILALKQRKN